MTPIDAIETKGFEFNLSDIKEQVALLNKKFDSKVQPVDGTYGTTVKVKDNGIVERTTKLGDHHYRREYYNSDGVLYKAREATPGKSTTIDYDDLGKAYLRTDTIHGKNVPESITRSLIPDTTVTKGNFTAQTDSAGRLVSAKLNDVKINNAERPNTTRFKDGDVRYLPNDDVGHMMGHNLGGPTGPENLLPQNQNVNRSAFRKVESEVKSLVESGKTVEYEMKINYEGSNTRPSSFEPKITVDGTEYTDLPSDLKKIYNDVDVTPAQKVVTNIKETYGSAHETGIKSGLVAAGITLAVSTVDNVSSFIDGEITAEEMVVDIVTETAAAGAIEYGSEIISTAVSHAMSKSSSTLISKVAGTSLPAAVVSFAVESYDCVTAFVKGEIHIRCRDAVHHQYLPVKMTKRRVLVSHSPLQRWF